MSMWIRRDRGHLVTRRQVLEQSAALGALGLAGNLVGTAITPAVAQATPRHGGVLQAAFSADPAGFDPVRGPSGMSHVVIEQVYSTLMNLDHDAKPYPDLAESYTVSPDEAPCLKAAPPWLDDEARTGHEPQHTRDRQARVEIGAHRADVQRACLQFRFLLLHVRAPLPHPVHQIPARAAHVRISASSF